MGLSLLNVYCRFGSLEEIDALHLHGRAVHELENDAAREEVDRHPDWSDNQVLDVLKQRGAQFGPDQLQHVKDQLPNMEDRTRLLGGKPRVVSFSFESRASGDRPIERRALLYWEVELEVAATDVGPRPASVRYALILQPFGEKLQNLLRAYG